ncbi:MAG: HAMP domain-containing histidine kinase [Clostridium sp.]|nr:HAMP domain-containing histidine kinase [Clostridium sp.]
MNTDKKVERALRAARNYLVIFLFVAFFITCSLMLFATTLADTLGVEFTWETVGPAARATMANILFLSLIVTAIDAVRRKYAVDRPIKEIIDATKKIMGGDFSVRIPLGRSWYRDDGFREISKCINVMAQELSGVETLRTDFIANVSHELKTPLAVMQNYSSMLQSPNLPEEKRIEYAKAVAEASRRLADLISNILKLNQLENQRVYAEAEPFNLGEQLCECLLLFEEAWEEKGLEMKTDIEEDVFVESDAKLLGIVWNNLFSNAVKFTEPGGCILLCLKSEGDFARVEVADTGCGISPETGKHIFEKFYQGDTSHAAQGNGLGLALVKRVVAIVGGDISVSSKAGEGSIFTVRIRRGQNGTFEKDI